MSHPESSDQHETRQSDASHLFVLAARFSAERPAKHTYFKVQKAIYRKPDNDLSVFRFQLNRLSLVAVLGETPEPTFEQRLRRLLAAGDLVTLPEDVVAMLLSRRVEASREGPWVEAHYRPGLRLDP